MMWWYGQPWSYGWIFMFVPMLLFVGAIAAAAVLIWRNTDQRRSAPQPESPEQILARRYAEGQIDHDEYLRRRMALHGDDGGVGSAKAH